MGGLLRGARIAVKTCMGVKRGEKVLVVTDPPRIKVARALIEAARELRTKTTLICMPVGKRHGEEPPVLVAEAMRAADVVLAPTTYSLTHTQARLRASQAGARIATMPMITEEMMCRGAMLADYREVSKLTKRVAASLDRASEVEITAPAGTDLRLSVAGRRAYPDTGIFHIPGDFGNLPAGEAFIAPVEGTAEGRVVVDGSMVDTVRGRIEISVEKGLARKISGGPARRLTKLLDEAGPKSKNVAEFGVGTNPKARLIGNVLEDEKVLGTCHIALGDNSTFGGRVKAGIHVDGIFLNPTVKLDGKILMSDGRLKV
ncbi:MAG: aminopeptidase [Candidatus Hodarchaeaceae archaeon]|nr:aminopeptidase [Candidatus Hodarchaeaceae archaeon]